MGNVGRIQRFPENEIPRTKTLYRLLWNGELSLILFEIPEVLARRKTGVPRISRRQNGKSIALRPQAILGRDTFGHWESDAVLGHKRKGEHAVFTIVGRLTGYDLSMRSDGKTVNGVADAMFSSFEDRNGIIGFWRYK